MIYSSTEFLALFPIFALVYWLVPGIQRKLILLLVSSLAFYTYGEPSGPWLLIGVISFTYAVGLAMEHWPRRAPLLATIGIVVLVLDLAIFKYAAFIVALVPLPQPELPSILLPLGISFFTFEAISYLVDIRRGVTRAERSPLHLALFMAVFPHLISGPIMRANDLIPQLRQRIEMSLPRFRSGLQLFVEGLLKKRLIGDTAGTLVDPVFLNAGAASTLDAWTAALAYTVQIYGDFAGYTDMGRGIARMLGLELPLNFNGPYVADSITDFWRRWHITLSSWLRDYLYFPLGGNRLGVPRQFANLMMTMLLGGLWHGAGWTWVLWGGYHGMLLILERLGLSPARLPRALGIALTLFLVVNGWVIFRSHDFGTWWSMVLAMYLPLQGLDSAIMSKRQLLLALTLLGVTVAGMAVARFRPAWLDATRRPRPLTGLAYGAAGGVAVLFVVLGTAPVPFIYFRF